MEKCGLPGLQARYELVPAGEKAELRLNLRFDPATSDPTQDAHGVWLDFRARLLGGTGAGLPPVAASLVTSLAAAPLDLSADGGDLLQQFADFLAEVTALPAQADTPVSATLAFGLPKGGARDLPGDIFKLDVRLEVGSETLAIALPGADEAQSAAAFATAFEEAWQGFDGADGRLALTVEEASEGGVYWCVRIAAAGGIGIARAALGKVAYHSVPPLSTTPLSGTVENDGRRESFKSVDLDSWWDFFVSSFDRLEAAAGGGEIGDRFRRARGALVRGLTGRLMPLARTEAGHVPTQVRAIFEEAATADLRWRPVVVSETVDVGRGGRVENALAPSLHARAATLVGAGNAPGGLPATVRLEAGRQIFAYAAPRASGDGARQPVAIRFEGERIERSGLPPLRLLLRSRAKTDPLGLDLDPLSALLPRIALPGPPMLSFSAAAASGDPATASAALTWSVKVESAQTPVAQDRLELALEFERDSESGPAPSPAPGDTLFDALGRAAMSARSMPDTPAPASIERFAALAEAVAEALPSWVPPKPDVRPLPGRWRYSVDFGALPALIVSREAPGSERLPPWPTVAGFVTPASEEGQARFEPEAGAEAQPGLRLSIPGLRLLADRVVQVHGRTSRNANIVDSVEPAFVYPGTVESSSGLNPWLDWQAPQPEPQAESLEAALAAPLNAIDEHSGAPYLLGLECALLRRLETAGGAPFESRIPLALLPDVEMGGSDSLAVADLARKVAAALSGARAGIEPDFPGEEVALTITLSDREAARSPLARLSLRITVPEDEAWWGPPNRGPDSIGESD